MAVILNEKQSTSGGPYAFYTVEVTTSNRTVNSIVCHVTVKAHLQYEASWHGTGFTVTPWIGLNGTGYQLPNLKEKNATWSGTAVRSVSKNITVTGLTASQTSMKATFRVDSGRDAGYPGGELTSTACSNITFAAGEVATNNLTNAPELVDTSNYATSFIWSNNSW